MSLLTKTTLLFLIVALLVFGIGGVVTYQMVKKEVEKETDYYLRETYQGIVKAIEEGKPIQALANEKVEIRQLDGLSGVDTLMHITDTLAMHPFLDRPEPHRKLSKAKEINGEYYAISLTDILIESDDMYEGVVKILSRLFLFLSLALLLFSVLISRWLLRPFQKTLENISGFNLKNGEPLELPETSTKEFRRLNEFIARMTGKVRRDYLALKEFTENASHEIQTPVAIAKGKLELLLESPDLTEVEIDLIQGAHQSISRISRISRGLSLLNKIGNLEFSNPEPVDFSAIVNQSVSHFRELAELKGLRLEGQIDPSVYLAIPPSLGEILVTNLIRNAIQHNGPEGWIEVRLSPTTLTVRNPGAPPSLPPHLLFERFRKGNQTSESPGLGLAIVQKIAEVNDWAVEYTFEEGIHQLDVRFSTAG